jgi:cardiolipin synthase
MKYNWREGNSVELCINGEEFFPAVFDSFSKAKSEIIVETFILSEDKVGHQLQQALIEAARRGVQVGLTVDDYGTWDLSNDFVKAMTEAGVRLHIFDPQPKLWGVRLNLFRRLHRKIVVVDQKIAFIGGINYCADHLMDFGEKAKQDYAVKLTGPIVADVHKTCMLLLLRGSSRKDRKAYFSNIKPTTPEPTGNTPALLSERDNRWHKKDIEKQYLLAIRTAKKRVVIANAYFFPRYFFLLALRRAARRGVDVTLILQGAPDMPWVTALSRLLYKYLLRSKVNIYEYCQRSLHGKVALVDDEWVTVGSSNLDPLSCSLNLETNVVLLDKNLNQTLYDHFQGLIKDHCKKLDKDTVSRGYWWRVPIIFLSFHFLRRFPSIIGWLPAHAPVLKMIHPEKRLWWKKSSKADEVNKADKVTEKTYNKESVS